MMQNKILKVATEIHTQKRITFPSDAGNVTSLTKWRIASNETADAGQGQDQDGPSIPVSKEQLGNALSDINEYVQDIQRSLKFSIDEETGETAISVIDKETEEVVRQIPPEITLEISQWLQSPVGIIIEDTL